MKKIINVQILFGLFICGSILFIVFGFPSVDWNVKMLPILLIIVGAYHNFKILGHK